ncbi:MAG: hypothetical protein WKF56_09995, partial [Candidatus Limnocylindrales bacterium]
MWCKSRTSLDSGPNDVSQTWLAGDGPRTAEQRSLDAMAEEQIALNTELLGPGRTFRALSHAAASL